MKIYCKINNFLPKHTVFYEVMIKIVGKPIDSSISEESRIVTSVYHSPAGELVLGSIGDFLCLCDWPTRKDSLRVWNRLRRNLGAVSEAGESAVTSEASRQLDEYFAGKRHEFDLPLLLAGTDFQIKIWYELTGIIYGETASYSEIAGNIGSAGSVRAVAAATGANALSIFVPCHRVLGIGGALTGYAGGLDAKRNLLSLETRV